MHQIHHPAIQKAHQHLHALSGDEQAWIQALQRERTLSLEATVKGALERAEREKAEAQAKGLAEGRAEGRAKGQMEGQAGLLRHLLRAKFGALPTVAEQQLQHASPAQLEHWAEQVLFADTPDQVFVPRTQ